MKKLFVSDLDGTLFYHNGKNRNYISEDNLKAINEFVSNGNIFAIASARTVNFLDNLTDMLGFKPPFISCNGGKIVIDDYIENHELSLADYNLFCEYFAKHNIDGFVSTYSEDVYYQSNRVKYPFNVADYNITERSRLMYEGIDTSSNPFDKSKICFKILLVLRSDLVAEVKEDLRIKFGELYEFQSSDIDNIDVMKKGCSKGKGIEIVAKYYGVDTDNVASIGDSENDLSMFKNSGVRFAMSNGIEDMKIKSDYIVDSVCEALKIFTK